MKLFYLLFAALLFCSLGFNSFAQAPTIQWAKCYGGSDRDEASVIRQTIDGGYIIGGYAASSNGDVTGLHNTYGLNNGDLWIVKLDDTGKISWQRTYGGNSVDQCATLQQTPDGGYIAIGSTSSSDGDVVGHHGVYTTDIWVLKLNKSGGIVWQKTFGGAGNETARGGQQTKDGGYIIVGYTDSADGDIKTIHRDSLGRETIDLLVVKLDSTGALSWEKTYGGSQIDVGLAIKQTSDEGYVAVGYTASKDGDVTKNYSMPGSLDAWVIKLDDTGKLIWQKTYGGISEDRFTDVLITKDGGYIFSGGTASNDGTVSGNHLDSLGHTNYDFWIMKTDSVGTTDWQHLYGGSSFDVATQIQPTQDSGYIVSGYTCSTDGDVGFNYNGNSGYIHDCWIINLTTTGDLRSKRLFGGTSEDQAASICLTKDGGSAFAGLTASTDKDVRNNHGGLFDVWVVKLSQPLAINSFQTIISNTITVFPNPLHNSFILQHKLTTDATVEVTDVAGRIICHNTLLKSTAQTTINASTWQPGMYFYKVLQNGNALQTGKLLKQ